MLRNRVFAVCATSTMVAAILTAGAPTASGVMSPVLPNGSFDDSLNGWQASGPSLSRMTPNPLAEVVNSTTGARTVTLNDQVNSANPVTPGTRYSATVRVRPVGRSADVLFRGQEWGKSGTTWVKAGEASQRRTLPAGEWSTLAFEYTAKSPGYSLDINVVTYSMAVGQVLQVDDIQLTDPAGTRFITNSTFDTGTSGWMLSTPGTLRGATESHNPVDGPFARATNGGSASDLSVTADAVANTGVGDDLTASVQVRAQSGQDVLLRLRERKSGTIVGERTERQTLTSDSWKSLATSYRAVRSGSTVEFSVVAPGMAAGRTLDVDSASLMHEPNTAPTAAISATANDLRVDVSGSGSSDTDGSVDTYDWDFGDGTTKSGATASHTYAAAGTYTVGLTVTDNRGATASTTRSVTVTAPNQVPSASFTTSANNLSVTVDGQGSSDPDGSIASYSWTMGDGTTKSGATASHTYAAAGTYTVGLTVTDNKGATHSTTKQVTVSSVAPSGWKLHWSDEFTGSAINTSNWSAYNNTYGDGNNELACLTPNNLGVANGSLTITSRKEAITCPGGKSRSYSSGFIGSREVGKYHPLYGRYEMRARVPHGQGIWPAFWLRHRNGASAAEVDILELFHSQAPGKVTQTLHFPNSLGTNVSKKTSALETAVRGTGGWHTYAVEIEPVTGSDGTKDVRFRLFVDDTQRHEYINTSPESWNGVDPNAGWDIAINTAVGGNWVGHPEQQLGYLPYPNKCSLTYKTPVNNDPSTCPTTGIHYVQLPAQYEIDYVRVYTRP